MRSPLAAWRAGVRWPLALIAVARRARGRRSSCARRSAGRSWSSRVQHRLAKTLDRRVVFGDEPSDASGVRIGLLGSVRVRAALDRDRRAVVERGAAHAAGPRRAPEARLPRSLARLARRAAAHRGARGGLARRACSSGAPTGAPRGSSAAGRPSERQRQRRTAADLRPAARRRRPCASTSTQVLPAGIDARFALSDGSARTARAAASVPARGERRRRWRFGRRCGAPPKAAASSGIFIRAGGAAGAASQASAESVRLAPGESGLRLKATGQYRSCRCASTCAPPACSASSATAPSRRRSRCRCARLIGRADVSFDGSTTRSACTSPALKGALQPGRAVARRGRRRARHHAADDAAVQDPRHAGQGRRRLEGGVRVGDASARAVSTARSRTTSGRRCRCSPAASAARAWSWPTSGPRSARRHRRRRQRQERAASTGRVIPDKKFDLPSLRAMDANILDRHRHLRFRHRRSSSRCTRRAPTCCSPTAC